MDIDLTTFALEVLNFLVLVWLLKRFLYKPVLDVIERRRAEGAETLAQANALREQAQALKARYEQRLTHADEDREHAIAQLDGEIAAARAKRLAAVDAEAQSEVERLRTLAARDVEMRDTARERRAIELAAQFASRLLDRLAGPSLEDRLIDMALADLPQLSGDQRDAVQAALQAGDAELQVVSAYPIAPARRGALTQALAELAGRPVAPAFVEDPSLKAGLCVRAGAWVLMANLRDELAFFGARSGCGV